MLSSTGFSRRVDLARDRLQAFAKYRRTLPDLRLLASLVLLVSSRWPPTAKSDMIIAMNVTCFCPLICALADVILPLAPQVTACAGLGALLYVVLGPLIPEVEVRSICESTTVPAVCSTGWRQPAPEAGGFRAIAGNEHAASSNSLRSCRCRRRTDSPTRTPRTSPWGRSRAPKPRAAARRGRAGRATATRLQSQPTQRLKCTARGG